jgi:hypothetical protein
LTRDCYLEKNKVADCKKKIEERKAMKFLTFVIIFIDNLVF